MIGDFTSAEPSLDSQKALKDLVSCGEASGKLSPDFNFMMSPEVTGQAFCDMIQRCNGLCV